MATPRGLSRPYTSFIGLLCQGIHRVPLTTNTTPQTMADRYTYNHKKIKKILASTIQFSNTTKTHTTHTTTRQHTQHTLPTQGTHSHASHTTMLSQTPNRHDKPKHTHPHTNRHAHRCYPQHNTTPTTTHQTNQPPHNHAMTVMHTPQQHAGCIQQSCSPGTQKHKIKTP